jgi:tRNA 5-methylaminomethyl-2-thiouridine biosynthesis bifunctional protein
LSSDTDPSGVEWVDGQLRSRRFDDLYFSKQGGLAEAREVFLKGCGLPERWHARRHFTVGELGFGTGLNILALLDLWAKTRPPGARLHIFSIEAFPLTRTDAAAAHAGFPELAALSATLLAHWPGGARGVHRLHFPGLDATLDLALLDVAEALPGWDGQANAWFLDGFAPARNPAMWSAEILAAVAAASAPGARAATYSVAAAVRQGLAQAGFALTRQPGFGHKQERLEARLPGEAAPDLLPRVAIIGAGIAGASLARAFRALGVGPAIFAAGPMASGNPAALASPRLAAGSAAGAALHAQAFRHAVRAIRGSAPGAILRDGVLRLLRDGEQARGAATATSGLHDPGSLRQLGGDEAADLLHEPEAPAALLVADGLVVDPAQLLAAWAPQGVNPTAMASIARTPNSWQLRDAAGGVLAEADIVVIAAGIGTAVLAGLPLRPVRGQVSTADLPLPGMAASWGGYAIPTAEGLLIGATHQRGDADPMPRAADDAENLAALASVRPALAAALTGLTLRGHAGVRAATGDHQPVAGQLEPGLFVLAGLGGRGFTLAPLLADHVAALALARPSPLLRPQARLVDPLRLKSGRLKPGRSGQVGQAVGRRGRQRDKTDGDIAEQVEAGLERRQN